MPLAPPPTSTVFPTWDDCIRFVQSHAAREGYAVNAKGNTKDKNTGLYRRHVIRCDKSGTFKSNAQLGTRRVSTKKTGCPFSAAANTRADGCHLKVLVPEHNHPPSALPAAHVQHRKLTDEQRRIVEAGAIERKSVRMILDELKALDPNTYINFKDIDNAIQKFRRKAKEGATGVQAIMYKLAERQDLYCFTLEKEGAVHGAFWVPRWSAELWMRNSGTPDILVMLTENIANRPVLPILEMNSVLNTAGFASAPPAHNQSNANAHPTSASSPDNVTNNNSPAPNTIPTTSNAPDSAGRSNNGLDASLGAGYAILPDKTDATILWLLSAVEKLRSRIPQCPKPRFLTLTDFQTAEKNILVEVSKGGVAHRQMHIVFGRVLNQEENQVHHGISTRKPRQERRVDGTGGQGSPDEAEGDDEEDRRDAEEAGSDGEEEENHEDGEDQDMDGDHDSDAEIARQLTGSQTQHNDHYHNSHNQSPGDVYGNPSPQQRNLEQHTQQSQGQNPDPGRLPLPPRARHPLLQIHDPAQMAYNAMMGRMPGNNMMNGIQPGHGHM